MGWRNDKYDAFLMPLVQEYQQSHSDGKLKEFWTATFEAWFKLFPPKEPSADDIAKAGSRNKAVNAAREGMEKKIKRFFSDRKGSGGRTDLKLEDSLRKRSEVQVYMNLFYDSRIRATVEKRWATEGKKKPKAVVAAKIAEDNALSEQASGSEGPKIEIWFKVKIATELWQNETESIKKEVRARREEEVAIKTVFNTEGKGGSSCLTSISSENTSSLQKNISVILKNVEKKCAGKGIMWIACPNVAKDGKPVGYFQSIGGGKDGGFEAFIGDTKAAEFKTLFSKWIRSIYPPSGDGMFNINEYGNGTEPTGGSAIARGGEDAGNDGSFPPPEALEPPQDVTTSAEGDLLSPRPLTSQPPNAVSRSDIPLATNQIRGFVTSSPALPPPNVATHSQPPPIPVSTKPPPIITSTKPVWKCAAQLGGSDSTDDSSGSCNTTNPSLAHPLQMAIDPVLLAGSVPEMVQVGGGGTCPFPSTTADSPTLFKIPEDAVEPPWMKKKGTLKYFRSTFKSGNLSGLLSNWYWLEKALGFQEQTTKGFPISKRPRVIATFIRNSHKYAHNYHLEADSLGQEILAWWGEISGTAYVGYGGPGGIYLMVVLVSWWCSLLKDQLDSDRTSYLTLVEELNHSILEAIPSGEPLREGLLSSNSPPQTSLDTPAYATRLRKRPSPSGEKPSHK